MESTPPRRNLLVLLGCSLAAPLMPHGVLPAILHSKKRSQP
jgi:hypothetical protein